MKLRQSFILGAAVAVGVFGLGAVGCGDDSSETTGAGGSGQGGDSSGTEGVGAGDVDLKTPPPRNAEAPAGDGDGAFLGITKLYLGETDRSGTVSSTAWQGFGYDLDGLATIDGNDEDTKFTSADLSEHCTPTSELAAGGLEDGPNGIDNSFGRNILSFIGTLLPEPSATATEAIEEGSFTIALDMTTLGTGTDYSAVPTNLFAGVGGEDGEWEYVGALLNNDDINDPKIHFDTAYVTANTWVSGDPQLITLNLAIGGVDLALDIQNAIVAIDLNGGHTGGTGGVIAGVLDTEAFIEQLGEVASRLAGDTEGLCPGDPVFESVVQTIRDASDILKDGSNRAGVPCDGISIAIGFDMGTVVFGELAPPPGDPEPSTCPPQ